MQNIKYPSINSNQPQLQERLYENSYQYQPQQQYIQIPPMQQQAPLIVNQQPALKNGYIKDLGFLEQKFYLISILSLFLLWTFIYLMFFQTLIGLIRNDFTEVKKTYQIQIPFEVIGLVACVIIGCMEKFRYSFIATLCFFGGIASYTFLIFSIASSFYYQKSDSLSSLDMFYMYLFGIQGVNLLCTIICLIYLFVETQELKFFKIIVVQVICFAPLGIVFPPAFLGVLLFLPYSFLLMHVLKQIQQGRFNLRQDQIMSGAMCACFGLFVPVQIDKFY